MKNGMLRLLLPLPLMLALNLTEAKAQVRGIGVGVGIGNGFPGFGPGYGYGYGPGWNRGFGPGWGYPGWWYPGVFPIQMYGNYGNGLSMYGPPVPTYKPIPGMFGGGDSMFFPPPSAYRPGYFNYAQIPIDRPKPLPTVIADPEANLPPTLEVLQKTAPLEVEIHVPNESAEVFIDGEAMKSSGTVRLFKTPSLDATESYTYDVKAVWNSPEGKVSYTKRVIGRSGERVKVEFKD